MGTSPGRKMDAGANRRAPRPRPDVERGNIPEAPRSRPDVPAPTYACRASREVPDLRTALVSAGSQSAGTHHPRGADHARRGGDAFPRWAGGVGSGRSRAAARTTGRFVREASPHGRSHDRRMDALPRPPRAPPRPADSAAPQDMSRKRDKERVTIRVPNPDAPVKERLKTPSHKVHRSQKAYRRRGKHPRPVEEE